MRVRLALAAMILTFAAQPVLADFSRVAVGLRSLGFERTWIPFLGLARSVVWMVQPKGIHDFQIAIYEKTPDVTGAEIERMIRTRMGRGYSPLVRVHSARKGESVFIYARPSRNGRIVELLILAHERNETVLVRVAADAEIVGRELARPENVRHIASR
ncbi:MAG TPA: DUF4252 domain-containing protein [Thermoanaerobaculia bacterium]|nr:DUF4252 domain-containing protein [Thermoanaerobaculia bacterium]